MQEPSYRWPLGLIRKRRLVAIVRLDDLSNAVPLAKAFLAGEVCLLEFTLTNPKAVEAITQVRQSMPEFDQQIAAVGVGSVRNVEQAEAAVSAGAQFVVTPTLNEQVIQYCRQAHVAVLPGAMTPTEILTAWEAGADAVKVFPARALGPNYVRDVLAPLPDLRLMPTGGIDLSNMQDYFSAGAFALGVGGNLLDKPAIAAKDWERVSITALRFARAAALPDKSILPAEVSARGELGDTVMKEPR